MKRSDAILSISSKIQKSKKLFDGYKNGNMGNKQLSDNLALIVLRYVEEELEMMPPLDEDMFGEFPCWCGGIIANRWEPEDEEE